MISDFSAATSHSVNILGKDRKKLKGIQKTWVIEREEFYCVTLTVAVFKQHFKIFTEKCIFVKTVHVKFGNRFRQHSCNNAGQKANQLLLGQANQLPNYSKLRIHYESRQRNTLPIERKKRVLWKELLKGNTCGQFCR